MSTTALGAARLRVVLEPLGVSAKRTGVTTIPRRQGVSIFSTSSQRARAEDACAAGMSAASATLATRLRRRAERADAEPLRVDGWDRAFRPRAVSRSLSCFESVDAAAS